MKFTSVVYQGLRYYQRSYVALALGVACAVAVLTGALLVGDSVRGSLRHLALDRLGKIDHLLILDRFIEPGLAERLQADAEFTKRFDQAVPAILFPTCVAEHVGSNDAVDKSTHRANRVTVFGVNEGFWKLAGDGFAPKKSPASGEICINQMLADKLHVKVGDKVILRLPIASQIPSESGFGEKKERTSALPDLTVIEILPDEGLGRFSLEPTQTIPLVAFVATEDVQTTLDIDNKVNAILVSNQTGMSENDPRQAEQLDQLLKPTLADFGFSVKEVRLDFTPPPADGKPQEPAKEGEAATSPTAETIYHYLTVNSERMLFDPTSEQVWKRALASLDGTPSAAQPIVAQLALKIQAHQDQTADKITSCWYSVVCAMEPSADGPLRDSQGKPLPPLGVNSVVITDWLAKQLDVKVGDRIGMEFLRAESDGDIVMPNRLVVTAIIPLTTPSRPFNRRRPPVFDERPTTANDSDLAPTVKGITDQNSMTDWKAPFDVNYKYITPQDDIYWENHRTTPKLYFSPEFAKENLNSRFGLITSLRIPITKEHSLSPSDIEAAFLKEWHAGKDRLGLTFMPLRAQSLQVSSGTTPFDVLFLLLSMFIIAAALLLVWLLVRLATLQRASEIGLLLSLGWTRRRVQWLLTLEGTGVVLVGSLLGMVVGVGYAALMLLGLTTWWVGAISTPFLEFHITTQSLLIGFLSGGLMTVLTIYLSLRGLRDVSIRSLLNGQWEVTPEVKPLRPIENADQLLSALPLAEGWEGAETLPWRFSTGLGLGLIGVASVLAFVALGLAGEAQAGAFLGSGAAALAGFITLLRLALGRTRRSGGSDDLWVLAFRNLGRNRSRSLATVTLVAVAVFLVIAVSSFRLAPTVRGTGGFTLLAESSQDMIMDIGGDSFTDAIKKESPELADCRVYPFAMKQGDDASCTNLYQPAKPRVISVNDRFIDAFNDSSESRFAFAGVDTKDLALYINPWHLLKEPAKEGEPVRVILDKNTAMYSLKLYGGPGQEFTVDYGEGLVVKFRVAALLDNSVLQGNLIIGKADFKRLFPTISGHRLFLIRTSGSEADSIEKVSQALETRYSDEGLDCVPAKERLEQLLAVQNTYISTFQALGALGLLLGTFGLVAVQLRNVLERRKELGLLRAIGFPKTRIGRIVLFEHGMLLGLGLLLGVVSALLTVVPHMLVGGAQVPVRDLMALMLLIVVVGIATGFWALRATLRVPLLPALRGD